MPDMEDEITADDGRVNVLDVAIALGLEGRKNNQPVRTYPRSTETAYQIAIGAMGLYRIEEHDCDGIKPLGEMLNVDYNERWGAESVAAVMATILAKDGAPELIDAALKKK